MYSSTKKFISLLIGLVESSKPHICYIKHKLRQLFNTMENTYVAFCKNALAFVVYIRHIFCQIDAIWEKILEPVKPIYMLYFMYVYLFLVILLEIYEYCTK